MDPSLLMLHVGSADVLLQTYVPVRGSFREHEAYYYYYYYYYHHYYYYYYYYYY